ncbi:MAG: glyoxalase [Cryobacterium sp.]|jgi:catechol 2,3-dioxygenase-like lactoylglutathione lyase family enzyme|nr:glyoxalase [Cryobacterium sp.]
MLGQLDAFTVLPAKDLQRARDYYSEKLGFEPSDEEEGGLMYRTGGGTTFFVYETDNAGTAKNTAMCWTTTDLDAEMTELRERGVTFEDYDFPGLKTENGVANLGTERSAWFVDSEGNILCLSEQTPS